MTGRVPHFDSIFSDFAVSRVEQSVTISVLGDHCFCRFIGVVAVLSIGLRRFQSGYIVMGAALFVGSLQFVGCAQPPVETAAVQAFLEGRIQVRAEVDSIPDFADFEVFIPHDTGDGVDTVGFAVTDSTGQFSVALSAPFEGVFPLIIGRRGVLLREDEIVVVDGDSTTLQAELPLGNRLVRLTSTENSAWMAYKNTKALYNQTLLRLLQQDSYDQGAVDRSVMQAVSILWSLQNTYPGTIGANIAALESTVMLDGRDDSLLVARMLELDPTLAGFTELARAARRAQSRLTGQSGALQLMRDLQDRVEDEDLKAAFQTEIVVAHIDSLEQEEALAAARQLETLYPTSNWLNWGERAIYELENLMPDMPAPGFIATTREGNTVNLDSLRGKIVILEFYEPNNQFFQQQFATRNAMYDALKDNGLEMISVSVHPDSVLNDALFEGREFPGQHIYAPGGFEGSLARLYNVNVLPTRYVIDRSGTIVGKFSGGAMRPIQETILILMDPNRGRQAL